MAQNICYGLLQICHHLQYIIKYVAVYIKYALRPELNVTSGTFTWNFLIEIVGF